MVLIENKKKIALWVVLFAATGLFFGVSNGVKAENSVKMAMTTAEINAAFDKKIAADKKAFENPGSNIDTIAPNDTRLHNYSPQTSLTPPPVIAAKLDNYTLLESFPGFFNAGSNLTDLPALVLAIYKFGIWTVGIAGLFMLVVGGFMYMASAGNNSTLTNAKSIIWDALWGIVAAMGAYLILYVINPDLTKLNFSFTPVDVTETLGIGAGGGSCAVLQDGPCSVENLKNTCFGSNAEAASRVCNYESGGNINSASKTDIMADRNIFSWGLFQINLTQHSLTGLDCPSAFNGKDYKSIVTDPDLYNKCKIEAQNGMVNINYACKISGNGKNWNPWRNTKNACKL